MALYYYTLVDNKAYDAYRRLIRGTYPAISLFTGMSKSDETYFEIVDHIPIF